ncbi:hypothetical protein ACFE04_011925 [Oxalis oulophora]
MSTFTDNNSSQFTSRLKETYHSLTVSRRPWRDFLDPTAINLPTPLSESTTRVTQNLTHFRSNYITIILSLILLTLSPHPLSLVECFLTLLAWFHLYLAREDALKVFNFTIDDKVVVAGLFLLTIGVLIWNQVWVEVFLGGVVVGGSLVFLHALLRSTDDLVMDDLESSPYGPMFELDDGSPEGPYSACWYLLTDRFIAEFGGLSLLRHIREAAGWHGCFTVLLPLILASNAAHTDTVVPAKPCVEQADQSDF